VPEPRALDLLVAATEIHTNAERHGGGMRELRVGRENGRFVCEITDGGDGFADPIAGYRVPGDPQRSPKGLWIARQLAWQVEFLRAPGAFTVRLWL
jgi:anti-sigma regulatory factor (Ser/Thr protein kinase)